MRNALNVVDVEVAKGCLGELTVPVYLKPTCHRHHDNHVQLATSLETAGKVPHVICSLIANLLDTYGEDLLAIIEARR